MEMGFSIYLGTDEVKNGHVIQKAIAAGMRYAFTSLHIPEEKVSDYRGVIKRLLATCREAGIQLIADISPHTLEKLACVDYDALLALGFDYIRPDFGYTDLEIVQLSKKFHLVFNASTLCVNHLKNWEKLGADLTQLTACHNFYPKPLTGLSLKRVGEMNRAFKALGMTTMAFVSGNLDYREPLFLGLPTVEDQRNGDVFLNMLQLQGAGASDVVLIGDVDVTDDVWERIKAYHGGYVALNAEIKAGYDFVKERVHHDRLDSSDHVIRSQASRCEYDQIAKGEVLERNKGAIWISNAAYLRYEGELEIARVDLEADERVNVIGYVAEEDQKYLPYIKAGMGFKFI